MRMEPETNDMDLLPAMQMPGVSEGCIKTSRFLMYTAVAGMASVILVLVAVNFVHISDTVAASRRITVALDERRGHYLARVDDAFDRTDLVLGQAIALVKDQILPMLANSSGEAKETLDKFVALLKSYSAKGRVTVEVPL